MATTIQVSRSLQAELAHRRLSPRETYEDVIWSLVESAKELNQETRNQLDRARAEIAAGKTVPLHAVRKGR